MLFKDCDDLCKIIEGEVGKIFLGMLDVKGIKGLVYWDNGFKIMIVNSLVVYIDDFLGLKMCIQFLKIFEVQFEVFGVVLQVMVFLEVYQVLQIGVVDGMENMLLNIYIQCVNEVQKYVIVLNYGYIGYVVIVNKVFWDGLFEDVCMNFDKVMVELIEYVNLIVEEENKIVFEVMWVDGVIEFYDQIEEECVEWFEVLKFVYEEMVDRIGVDLIQQVYVEFGIQ